MTVDWIEKKVASVLVKDAVPMNPDVRWVANYETLGLFTPMMKFFRWLSGGDWVGGNIFLYRDRLLFRPNSLNQAVLDHAPEINVPLATITEITTTFGLIAGIVIVKHDGGKICTVRCYGAEKFAKRLRGALN
jgi:hypothetical protein